MSRLRRSVRGAIGTLGALVVLLGLCAAPARAQGFGYGAWGSGFGYPAYGYPGYGFGYGYPAYGVGGFAGYGFGYGFPGFGYATAGFNQPWIGPGFGAFANTAPGLYNPMFGLGLTPLGTQSALTERYLLGRGIRTYNSGYGNVRRSYAPVR